MRARLKPHPHFFLSAIYATRPLEKESDEKLGADKNEKAQAYSSIIKKCIEFKNFTRAEELFKEARNQKLLDADRQRYAEIFNILEIHNLSEVEDPEDVMRIAEDVVRIAAAIAQGKNGEDVISGELRDAVVEKLTEDDEKTAEYIKRQDLESSAFRDVFSLIVGKREVFCEKRRILCDIIIKAHVMKKEYDGAYTLLKEAVEQGMLRDEDIVASVAILIEHMDKEKVSYMLPVLREALYKVKKGDIEDVEVIRSAVHTLVVAKPKAYSIEMALLVAELFVATEKWAVPL